ncbi:MAG: type II secretion system F family protein [Actinomycetota bacterium]|nr:type II secretion system F family protein [Actinomycetota bacterium]
MITAVLATVTGLAGAAGFGWSVLARRPAGGGAPGVPWMRQPARVAKEAWPRPARLLVAAAVAILAGLVTGWPVGALLAGCAAVGLPALWAQTGGHRAADRLEAVAAWTEMLRDTLHASVGLSQAVVATAAVAPPAIRPAVTALADRLAAGVPATVALRTFAADLDDASADVVVCALLLAATARAQRLADLLGALATATREDVVSRLHIDAARASARSGIRIIVVFSIGFVAALAVLAHSYLAPFGSVTGQLVLAVVGACDTAALVLLARMTRPPVVPRLLDTAGCGSVAVGGGPGGFARSVGVPARQPGASIRPVGVPVRQTGGFARPVGVPGRQPGASSSPFGASARRSGTAGPDRQVPVSPTAGRGATAGFGAAWRTGGFSGRTPRDIATPQDIAGPAHVGGAGATRQATGQPAVRGTEGEL